MGTKHSELREQRGEYGFDGFSSRGLAAMAAGTLVLLASTTAALRSGRKLLGMLGASVLLVIAAIAPFYLYVTRRGKFLVWAELLDELPLQGNERVLDLGCGRGAVMGMVAKLLPQGLVVGLDLWTADQSGNRPSATTRNLVAEGIAERCQVTTGTMLALPFADASFDLVVTSLAIHNIDQISLASERRLQALDEAVRVLKPGGRMLIVDLMWTRTYAGRLRALGLSNVRERNLGWRCWYGPWMGANLVTALKAG
jgi:SAM-dependent methyltransferase